MNKKFIIKLLSCFIFSKKKRRLFREKHLGKRFGSKVFIRGKNYIDRNVDIGDYTYVCDGSRIFTNTKIGKFCSIATDVTIGASLHPTNFLSTHPFQYCSLYMGNDERYSFKSFPETIIGNDVWIGCGVIIKCGVTIGNGAILGSGAVVTKDVPPYAVIVGVPGKILKYRFSDTVIKQLEKIKWWNYPENKLKDLPFDNVEKCIEILKAEEKYNG